MLLIVIHTVELILCYITVTFFYSSSPSDHLTHILITICALENSTDKLNVFVNSSTVLMGNI